jgi:3-oxoacyl-[acyl-carrier protein] reductase
VPASASQAAIAQSTTVSRSARELARAGASVAFTYLTSPDRARQVTKDIEADGGRALAIEADSADPAAIVAAVNQAVREFGQLDILVNNAATVSVKPFGELTLAEIDQAIAVQVRAAVVAAQAAVPHMPDGGRIITIGSCLSERTPGPGLTLLAMTKAALDGFTKGLARDLGPRGITVTTVHPGPIATESNPPDGPHAEFQRSHTALGRYGTAEDVAATVAHLAGPAGRYITGTAIAVDGGYAA